MIKEKVRDRKLIKMAIHSKANFKKINPTASVHTLGLMVKSMKASGAKALNRAKASGKVPTTTPTRATGMLTSPLERASIYGPMATSTRASGSMV